MSLLIKNGNIVTAERDLPSPTFTAKAKRSRRIGKDLDAPPGARVIDATGKYVFPGFIDPHVHIYLPFMGTFAKDDYATGQQGRARRRHHDADRNVLPGAQRRAADRRL